MKNQLRTLFVGMLTLSAAPAAEPTVEERLARIEAQLSKIQAQMSDKVDASELEPALKEFGDLTKKLGWDGKSALTVVKPAGKEKSLTLGGYAQLQGDFGDAPDSRYNGINDRFLLRRVRLSLKASWSENIDFVLVSDFGNNSIGNVSGARAQIADAYVTWTKYPWATLQLGQFKTPFGYEQLLADTKTVFAERTLPNDSLTVSRQAGFGLSGSVLEKKLNYSIGLFNGTGVNNGNNDNDQFMTAGRVSGQVYKKGDFSITAGANAYASRDSGTPINGTRTGLGADFQASYKAFDVGAEYLYLDNNRISGTDTSADGYYAWAGYYWVPKLWQTVLRFEQYTSDTDRAGTTSKSWTAGVNYYLKGDDIKLMLNYQWGDPAGAARWQGRLVSRVQVVF